jgi:hypothetical protein
MSALMEVLLLTQEHCSLCEHAKQVLDRLAADYPLQVTVQELASPRPARWPSAAGSCSHPGCS